MRPGVRRGRAPILCRSGDPAANDVAPAPWEHSRPGGRSHGGSRPLGTAFHRRSGALAAKDAAPAPWNIRGRVAAPTNRVGAWARAPRGAVR